MNASKEFKEAYFNYIGSITLSIEVANSCGHGGDCTNDVKECMQLPEIKAEFAEIDPKQLIKELEQYGGWDEKDLQNHNDNLERILWLAASEILEELNQ